MAEVSIHNIEKRFGDVRVLKGVSLDIADGEFVSLVGPSGCGKSTLLRIIAGLEMQDAGSIGISGNPVDRHRPADRNLAMVFQSYALYPHLTVFDNIAVPLRMKSLNRLERTPFLRLASGGYRTKADEIDRAVRDAAALLDISHLLDRKPGQLSGGQRQRVAVGRAIVRNPMAFLMDEPLSNLDAKLRVHMRTEIAELHRKLGATFIYVTHDQAEAMTMSDRIAIMMDGEIIQVGTPDEVYHTPVDVRVAEFIGSPKINTLTADVSTDGRVSLAGADIGMQARNVIGPVSLCFRSEEAVLLPAGQGRVQGIVRHVENLGAELFVQVYQPEQDRVLVVRTGRGDGWTEKLGEAVGIGLSLPDVKLFNAGGRMIEIQLDQPIGMVAANG